MKNRSLSITDGLLRDEIENRGWDFTPIYPPKCDFILGDNKIIVKYNGVIISTYDYYIVKKTKGIELETYKVAKAMEAAGVKVVDEADSLLCGPEKLLPQLQRIGEIPIPLSVFCHRFRENTIRLVRESGIRPPFIVKPQTGTRSRGVETLNNFNDLNRYEYRNSPFIVQEKLPIYRKYRIIITGDKVCGHWTKRNGYKRKYDRFNFTTANELALKATSLQKGDIWGVDIIDTGESLYIIECNRNPGFSSFTERNIRIEKEIIDYIIGE